MGDPTLRMNVVAPPSNVAVSAGTGTATISWTASADAVAGYYVYRAASDAGPFTRLTPSLVTGASFVDTAAPGGSPTYLVRAVRIETTPSGSYWNASTGISAGPVATFFHTLAPCRALDTRLPAGPGGGPALAAGGTRTFVAIGACGLPATARSVSANVTVTNASAGGTLIVYPADLPAAPNTLTLAFRASQTRANNSFVALASDGSGAFKITSDATAAVDVIVDVNGWFE
jgi:hypothetical protein